MNDFALIIADRKRHVKKGGWELVCQILRKNIVKLLQRRVAFRIFTFDCEMLESDVIYR